MYSDPRFFAIVQFTIVQLCHRLWLVDQSVAALCLPKTIEFSGGGRRCLLSRRLIQNGDRSPITNQKKQLRRYYPGLRARNAYP
jgi:hypothetical protein